MASLAVVLCFGCRSPMSSPMRADADPSALAVASDDDAGVEVGVGAGDTAVASDASRPPGEPDAGVSAGHCEVAYVALKGRPTLDLLLLLDASDSLSYDLSQDCYCDHDHGSPVCPGDLATCRTRWATLSDSMGSLLKSLPASRWGLALLPSSNNGACAMPTLPEVSIGPDNVAAIEARLDLEPRGRSSIAVSVDAAARYLATLDDRNQKAIILATDAVTGCGEEVPDGHPAALQAVTVAAASGFPIFVLGVGPEVADLTALAVAGRTGNYYPAEAPERLARDLNPAGDFLSCTFGFGYALPDPEQVAVYLDKTLIPRDPADGWSFDATGTTLNLAGSYCERVRNGEVAMLQVLFACAPVPPGWPP